jgi:hypothetical protein
LNAIKSSLVGYLRKRRSRKGLNAIEDASLAHINARYMAFVSGPEMQSRGWSAELKEKERKFSVAFGPPLTYREQALLSCLSTLYPPKKVEISPEFLAEQSAFWTGEFDDDDDDDDRYSLEHQRASADAPPDPAPPADSTPSEAVDNEDEWVSTMDLARLQREQRQRQLELFRQSGRMKRVITS